METTLDKNAVTAVSLAAATVIARQKRNAPKSETYSAIMHLLFALAIAAEDQEVKAAIYHQQRGEITKEEAARQTWPALQKYKAAAASALKLAVDVPMPGIIGEMALGAA